MRHRVCLFLPFLETTTASGARAAAEPTLNDWAEKVIGDLGLIGCTAHFIADDEEGNSHFVTLAQLQPPISALDFVYMCASLPGGEGDTEIEARLRRYVRQERLVKPDSALVLALNEAASGHSTVEHAMELGRSLLEVLGNVTAVTPPSLTQPDDAPAPPFYGDGIVETMIVRAETANGWLSERIDPLASDDTGDLRVALDECAQYGIPEAVIDRINDPSIPDRARRVQAIIIKRTDAATRLITAARAATGDARLQNADEALKALFGESFLTLFPFDASALAPEKTAAFNALYPPSPGAERLWLWLHQVAETHPRVRRVETFLLMAEAWGQWALSSTAPLLEMAQLPRVPGVEWQALSDDEMTDKTRLRAPQSIVALKPPVIDPTRVTGFVIDEWTETMPATSVSTGISFEYNQPANQPPQCFLLAVPGNFDDAAWTAEHLAGIVRDTMDLAKVRLVDLDALPNVAGLAPALLFPLMPPEPSSEPSDAVP